MIDGEIVSPHPVELGAAYGTAPCVHCQQGCQSYCKSCRKPVCPADFDVHRGDHNPADRTQTWTQTGPHAATTVDAG